VEVLLVGLYRHASTSGSKSRLPRPWHQQKVGSLQLTHQDGFELLSELGQIWEEASRTALRNAHLYEPHCRRVRARLVEETALEPDLWSGKVFE